MRNQCFWLSLLILFFSFLNPPPSLAALTTISGNQSLSGDQTLVSKGGTFELGFFKPGNNSSNYYIGMWYKKVSQPTFVWVANRDHPISDKKTAKLTISGGNLVLFDGSSNQVWSTNITNNSGSVVAVLLDSGNLVLRDRVDAPESDTPLWQSFDHPTDTWLPGGKIKLDNKTKKPQYLTSWKNTEDPATGLFSLELDPKGTNSYLILWNKSEEYWTSGPWNGRIFSLVPEMRANYIYNFTFVANENESYFTYSLYNPSIISRFVMDISGQIKQLSWLENIKQWNLFWSQPRRQCDVYAFCGAFGSCTENSMPYCSCLTGFGPKSQSDWDLEDHSGGCQRKTKLQCEDSNASKGNKDKDKFLAIPNMALPKHAQSVGSGNIEECESTCFNNCSCSAYAYDSNGCSIWIGELLNLQQLSSDDSSRETLYLKLAASEFDDAKSNKGVIIGVVVGVVVGIGVLLALILFFMVRRRRRMVGTGKPVEGSLVAFGYRDLQNATKNFSEKLGGGGFGYVFKGTLADSSFVAVKRLESISQGEKQFRSEVSTIGTVQHVNLVRLRGFCSEGAKKLLVYDYMPNGSLDFHLFKNQNSEVLDWKVRYQIALGTARGLTYLHEKCRDCIIHCDVKPENILLDADFCPKVADFGLAKLVGREFSRVLTTMRGTRGYLAPEWISGVAVTAKADVYSYGMMLFEFVSGRRNSDPSEDGQVKFFPTFAANVVIQGGNVLSLLDPRLEGNADIEEVTKVIKVASWCVQDSESFRPSMGQVVQILEGIMDVNVPPLPRSLQVFEENPEKLVFFTDSSSNQSSQVRSNVSGTSSQVKSSISSASNKSMEEN
ncbi:G-type lectin S-receptor-like serine/threonine-protein kinase At2g19130 [Lotus japonicus]|uniref:G-type lectin S-receptor-like serine/threonine-protein kinase At2g19130 n=1 Tax=Lotus japonicus TaxID=34305 RepID=UPI0025848DD4|nr:G-type lectin S-receptor-like serine/threonine-protein kinase At2g19130 [Lotus japonicus]